MGVPLTMDDPTVDPSNPSCFSLQSSKFMHSIIRLILLHDIDTGPTLSYGGGTRSPNSSLTLLAGSLAANETYQLMVILESRRNPSIRATGYLLVQVEATQHQLVVIG